MSSKSGHKRTYVWAKAERTCVILAIAVLSMSSKSGDKTTYVCAKTKRTCVLIAIGEQEVNSEYRGKFHQSPETKKKVIKKVYL